MPRVIPSLALSLLLVACGAAHARPDSASEIAIVPFELTLPAGDVLTLDASGAIHVDGAAIGTLEPDGRVTRGGTTLATLAPDGRMAFEGEPTALVVRGRRLEEDGAIILELADDDRALTLHDGSAPLATLAIAGVRDTSRATALFVTMTHLLLRLRQSQAIAREIVAGDAEAGVTRMRVPIEGRPARGAADAPVTLVIVDDFECPYCARAARTMHEIGERYGRRVRFVFLHYPLPFHDHAWVAATAAEEAFVQRGDAGFWAMHDMLFEHQRALSPADLLSYGAALGLDVGRLERALGRDAHSERITLDRERAIAIGVRGTPAFFVNGVPVMGARPLRDFVSVIDRELTVAEAMVARGIAPARVFPLLMAAAHERAPEPSDDTPREPPPAAFADVPAPRDAPSRGARDAPVVIQVWSDFQCPFCGEVLPTLARLLDAFAGRVRIVFRHNPLPFHPHAMRAAETAIEVFRQGGDDAFHRLHDLLFANQRSLSPERIAQLARQALPSLDVARLERALAEHAHEEAIDDDIDALRDARIGGGTPTFLVGRHVIGGAEDYEVFRVAVEAELAALAR